MPKEYNGVCTDTLQTTETKQTHIQLHSDANLNGARQIRQTNWSNRMEQAIRSQGRKAPTPSGALSTSHPRKRMIRNLREETSWTWGCHTLARKSKVSGLTSRQLWKKMRLSTHNSPPPPPPEVPLWPLPLSRPSLASWSCVPPAQPTAPNQPLTERLEASTLYTALTWRESRMTPANAQRHKSSQVASIGAISVCRGPAGSRHSRQRSIAQIQCITLCP